jgi:outer membrane protein OmpA-like peptidoglycan-associated protein
MEKLAHPQSLGALYTTYVLWAVAPEGQAASLAELPNSRSFDVDVTTSFPTFGLVVTAEPHAAVTLPGALIVAENAAREDTTGRFQSGRVEYAAAASVASTEALQRDFNTPLPVLGARRAVQQARSAEAERYASNELQDAERKLEMLERAWPQKRELPKSLAEEARDVMRLAEHARKASEDRRDQALLASERRSASAQVARAQTQAELARQQADQERARAEQEQKVAAVARQEAARARNDEEVARVLEADARSQADAARQRAEQAMQRAEAAQQEKSDAQQQLFQSLSAILETRREARGLIVNLSDVLFDFDRATLTPGAREKLSKLAGVLLAYPGSYRMQIEGHTDSVGSSQYNLGLSVGRAESVRSYLQQSGIPTARIAGAAGFGEDRPVASNDSDAGRQMNRRVEIVISDLG